jgi:hypothetical protein
MSNQQQPPAQPTSQVPDQRWNEMMSRVRQLEDQNAQLRGQVDFMARRPGQPQQTEKPLFEAPVDKALEQKFQQLIQPVAAQMQQTIGFLTDQNDQIKFESRYQNSHLKDYLPKVEELVRQNKLQNRWVPREDVLQYVYFQETGKKPAEPKQTVQEVPKASYDPYTGQFLGPDGKPTLPPSQMAMPQGQPPQSVETVQVPAQQPQQAQPEPTYNPGYQPTPQNQFAQPAQPNLPPATPPPPAQGVQPAGPVQGLSLQASDKQLATWADQYGDMPL